MRKFSLFVLACAGLYLSCNFSDPVSPTTSKKIKYLSQVFTNGKVSVRFFYDANHFVDSINYYDVKERRIGHLTYKYVNGKPISMLIYFYSNTSSEVPDYVHRFDYQYDTAERIKKVSECVDSTDAILAYQVYEYSEADTSRRIYHDTSQNELYYIEVFRGSEENERILEIYDSKTTLKAVLTYELDDKINSETNLPVNLLNHKKHNELSLSSSVSADSLGTIHVDLGITRLSYTAFHSTFQYDDDGYPTLETRTNDSSPSTTISIRYEYLQ